jgi:biotin carboxyl carrier protein
VDLTVTTGRGPRQVRVVRHGDRLLVTVDGREFHLDVRQVREDTLSLLVAGPDGPARSIEASFSPQGPPGAFDVHVAGRRIPVQVQNGHAFGRSRPSGGGAGGPLRAIAPMPGKIVRILVKPGDDVRARQGLVVVEAMKMENELRAAGDGRVRLVAVEEGQSVDAGAVLVEIEPAGEPGQ